MSAIPGVNQTSSTAPIYISAKLSGNAVFWKTDNSIYRLVLASTSTPELMITAANLIAFKVMNGSVIYHRYITGTNVRTYQISEPGEDPVILADEDMEIQSIVELN